jgi:hypothetical protein
MKHLWLVLLVACTSETSSPVVTPAPPAPVVAPKPAPPAPPKLACTADADCNFADPANPGRCVAAPGSATNANGSCTCFEGSCAMRPKTEQIGKLACENSGQCDLDVTTAQCDPGLVSDDEFKVRWVGPVCRCSPKDQRCHTEWIEPVACKTVDDCWVSPDDRPIARPAKHKGKTFRGCKDGERVPVCVKGQCSLDALMC